MATVKDAAWWRDYRARKRNQRNPATATPATRATAIPQPATTTRPEASPAHARKCNFPEPRKPGKPRVPLCAPTPPVDYYRAKKLLLTGMSMGEACAEIGNGCTRAALMEAAHVLDDVVEFNNTEQFCKRAVSDRIAREALAAGVAQDRIETVDEDGPKGSTTKTTRKRSIDVAALRLASEHVAPEIHGKLARTTDPNAGRPIQVAVVFVDQRMGAQDDAGGARGAVDVSGQGESPSIDVGGDVAAPGGESA